MASLSIRQLNDSVYEALRLRAARHGNSMEEETGQIISRAVSAPECIADVFKKYFGPKNGIRLVIIA